MLSEIPIKLITEGTRLRKAGEAQISSLVASIRDVGVLSPIVVYPRKVIVDNIAVDGYGLVAGLHRLTACKELGLETIPAQIVSLGELERQIAECDENLCGTKLTAAEKALFTRRRKEAYEALHPEAKAGAIRAKAANVVMGHDVDDNLTPTFTQDTARKTGQDIRAVQRDAERGEKIDEAVLAEIQGTHLDSGAYMDKLKGLSKVEQRVTVKRDLDKHQKEAERQDEQARADKEAREGAEWIAEEFGVAAIPALVALLETVAIKKLCAELRRHL